MSRSLRAVCAHTRTVHCFTHTHRGCCAHKFHVQHQGSATNCSCTVCVLCCVVCVCVCGELAAAVPRIPTEDVQTVPARARSIARRSRLVTVWDLGSTKLLLAYTQNLREHRCMWCHNFVPDSTAAHAWCSATMSAINSRTRRLNCSGCSCAILSTTQASIATRTRGRAVGGTLTMG